MKVVGVRFKKIGKIYYFDPLDMAIEKDSGVVVETSRGVEYGTAVVVDKDVEESETFSPLKPVIRIATEEDRKKNEENKAKEKEAINICKEKIKYRKLQMKLIDCEITFDGSKMIFYFTADGRIDFRDLVKDLAAIFKTRIELRQIGVRDEAKMVNGIGICGRSLCCATFLGDFQPVSIKMAKDQGLSLNPTKISGVCGRLMCCLKYEQDTYEELLKDMPGEGDIILTPDGEGEVISVSVLRQLVKAVVKKENKNDVDVGFYSAEEVRILKRRHRKEERKEDYSDFE